MINHTSYDVIVAGGGIAGVAAAISSARLGAKTLLIERYGFLGGLATAGLVNPFMTHRASTGEPLIAGLFDELRSKLTELDGLSGSTFDAEAMKTATQEMVLDSGADILLHTWIKGTLVDEGVVRGVTVVNKSGERAYSAKRVIDATGDGDVAVYAGAGFESGGQDGLPQAMTMMLDVGDVDLVKVMTYVKDHPDQMRFPKLAPDADPVKLADGVISVAGYYDLIEMARTNGDYPIPGDLIFFISRPHRGEVTFNTTHIGEVNGTSAEDLTKAEIEGRRQSQALVRFIRKYVPGFENAHLLQTATQVGVRETRRITGDYKFSADDVVAARKFDDCIARLAYPVDVHSGKGDGYTKEEEQLPAVPGVPPPGDWYEIPYRCLLPIGVENLLVAGRCVSSTQAGHGAIRIIPCCVAMGQAAGTAAALSLRDNVAPRMLNVETLLKELRAQGALV